MYNKVTLIGRIANNLQLQNSVNGNSYLRYSVAVDGPNRQNNDNTMFISCVSFGKTAEFMNNYLVKGALILVEGTLSASSYIDKNGNKNNRLEVIGNNITPLESRQKREELAQRNSSNFKASPQIPVQTPEQYQQLNQNEDNFVAQDFNNTSKSTTSIFDDEDWE